MYALSHVVALVGLTFAATQPVSPVEQDADPMQVMEQARELAAKGQHEEALAKLLWCFDHGAQDPSFTGVRVSFLPLQIAELGKKYPPALEALQQRREAAAQRAGKTKGTLRYGFDLMELTAINHCLGEDAANLEIYDRLKSEAPDSPILEFILHLVVDELIKAGRADEAREASAARNELKSGARMPVTERAWPRDVAARQESSSGVRSTTAYSLDHIQYAQDLAAAQDEAGRLDVLKRRWDEVALAVTYCNVVTDVSFYGSVENWRSGFLTTGTWTLQADGDLLTAPDSLSRATVLVKGDCQADISVSGGGMVHIYGDLSSNLTISGQSEVVIGGDITADGAVDGDGILRVFVGGSVEGRISNKGSSMLWINGDVSGTIHAGRPSTKVHVIGDFFGQFLPVDVAALAYLDVRGNMPFELIERTARCGWTVFNASVGSSNAAPGLYPKSRASNSCWVVHAQYP